MGGQLTLAFAAIYRIEALQVLRSSLFIRKSKVPPSPLSMWQKAVGFIDSSEPFPGLSRNRLPRTSMSHSVVSKVSDHETSPAVRPSHGQVAVGGGGIVTHPCFSAFAAIARHAVVNGFSKQPTVSNAVQRPKQAPGKP